MTLSSWFDAMMGGQALLHLDLGLLYSERQAADLVAFLEQACPRLLFQMVFIEDDAEQRRWWRLTVLRLPHRAGMACDA